SAAQPRSARRAAAIASRTSSRVALATAPIVSPSAGSTTSKRDPSDAGRHSPSTKRSPRRRPESTSSAESGSLAVTAIDAMLAYRPRLSQCARSLDSQEGLAHRALVDLDPESSAVRKAREAALGTRRAGGDPLGCHLARQVAGEQELRRDRTREVCRRGADDVAA